MFFVYLPYERNWNFLKRQAGRQLTVPVETMEKLGKV